jgi:hypothetical protein
VFAIERESRESVKIATACSSRARSRHEIGFRLS